MSLRDAHGQSSVELVALLPLVLVLALGVMALLGARAAAGQAAASAQAGAMALIQDPDGDAEAAARTALPAAARRSATIRVRGRAVVVTVRPRVLVGFLGESLAATASADAGPEPSS